MPVESILRAGEDTILITSVQNGIPLYGFVNVHSFNEKNAVEVAKESIGSIHNKTKGIVSESFELIYSIGYELMLLFKNEREVLKHFDSLKIKDLPQKRLNAMSLNLGKFIKKLRDENKTMKFYRDYKVPYSRLLNDTLKNEIILLMEDFDGIEIDFYELGFINPMRAILWLNSFSKDINCKGKTISVLLHPALNIAVQQLGGLDSSICIIEQLNGGHCNVCFPDTTAENIKESLSSEKKHVKIVTGTLGSDLKEILRTLKNVPYTVEICSGFYFCCEFSFDKYIKPFIKKLKSIKSIQKYEYLDNNEYSTSDSYFNLLGAS
jgi:hypothetical protein